ncbi:MAG: 4-oxalomesaconate tautomerase [Parasphingorhabdus sp.]|jgi:4-oxalomesaconate tautomerase
MGLVKLSAEQTTVRIHSVNTGALVEALVETPGGQVSYDGDTTICGIPGTSAPVQLGFEKIVGSQTNKLFPTGSKTNTLLNTRASCLDVVVPMVITRASDFGIDGNEDQYMLNNNQNLLERIESIRLAAAQLMGLGDRSQSVIPKFGLRVKPKHGGSASVRYFTPWKCHPALAVTSSLCISACLLIPDTIAHGLVQLETRTPTTVNLEHLLGSIDVRLDYEILENNFHLHRAAVLRTTRLLFSGLVAVPGTV